jgi:hypothetical protein
MAAFSGSVTSAMNYFERADIELITVTYPELMGLVEEAGLNPKLIAKLKMIPQEKFLATYGCYVYKFKAARKCNKLAPISYAEILLFLRDEVKEMMREFENKYRTIELDVAMIEKKRFSILEVVPASFACAFHDRYGKELIQQSKELSGPAFLFKEKQKLYFNVLNDCRQRGWFNRVKGNGKLLLISGASKGDFVITMNIQLFCIALNYNYFIDRVASEIPTRIPKDLWTYRRKQEFYGRCSQEKLRQILLESEPAEVVLTLDSLLGKLLLDE